MFLIDEFIVDDFTVVEEFDSTSCWTCPDGVDNIEYLIVAGGGGAGGDNGGSGVGTGRGQGGAGGGGVRLGTNFPVIAGQTYKVTIGAGGTGSSNGSPTSRTNGEGSSIEKILQYGSLETRGFTGVPGVEPGTFSIASGFFHIGANGGSRGPGNYNANDNEPGACGSGQRGGFPANRPGWGPGGRGIELAIGNGHAEPTSYPGINQQPPFSPSPPSGQSGQGFVGGTTTFGNPNPANRPDPNNGFYDGPAYTPNQTDAGSGGGGAGQAGFPNAHTPSDGSNLVIGGNGGNGILTNITGRYQYFGGGGGGGTVDDIANGGLGGGGAGGRAIRSTSMPGGEPRDQQKGEAGSTNTGGGAGGTVVTMRSSNPGTSPNSGISNFGGANGGSGKVVIRYKHPGRLKGDTVVTHEFTSTQQFIPIGDKYSYLIVAGGGGGGYWLGGGGGAGGVRIGSSLTLTPGVPVTINIGAGGAGGNPSPTDAIQTNGSVGGDSYIQQENNNITPNRTTMHIGSNGGGGGARYNSDKGTPGGSGGGGSRPGSNYAGTKFLNIYGGHPDESRGGYRGSTVNYLSLSVPHGQGKQGSDGGQGTPFISPAGGGGAGGVGQNAAPTNYSTSPTAVLYGGNGGPPIEYVSRNPTILTSRYFAGGGGGGVYNIYAYNSYPKQASGQLGGNTSTPTLKGGAGDGGVTSITISPYGNNQPSNPQGTSTEQQVNQLQSGSNGLSNTGGGGGGAGYNTYPTYRNYLKGGTGGSGIIILEELISRRVQLFETKVFTSSTSFTVGVRNKADYLIVAGGGGGGHEIAGGAGAGGFRMGTGLVLTEGATYTVNVGGGGSAGTPQSPYGGNGVGSYIESGSFHLGTNGGGRTVRFNTYNAGGLNGGSGGGAPQSSARGGLSITFTSANGHANSPISQGNNGGLYTGFMGAGGGGGITDGENAIHINPTFTAGNGGSAISYTYNGITQTFAGGGGGGRYSSSIVGYPEYLDSFNRKGLGGNGGGGDYTLRGGGGNGGVGRPGAHLEAQNGVDNTGGGGGGGRAFNGDGGSGGSGIIILKLYN